MMTHPSRKEVSGPREPSPQAIVEELVRGLNVTCLGVEGGAIIFQRLPGNTNSQDQVAGQILKLLAANDALREKLHADHITKLRIS